MRGKRPARAAALLILGTVALTGCGFGLTLGATTVHDTDATVTGRVSSDKAETVEYWFEYGPTTAYGRSTPHVHAGREHTRPGLARFGDADRAVGG